MKIEQRDISELKPYEFNNRVHGDEQVAHIAKSIKEFGFNQPVVIDEEGTILVGHGRVLAAKKLSIAKVPTVQVKNLTDEQKRAYRILDNKLQNDSTWQFNNLELELGYLEDNDFDIKGWGLDELKDLFPEEEIEPEEDAGPSEPPQETFIKRGDIIEIGKHRVMCGDSTSAEDIDELIIKVIDLVLTDPPYGVSYVGKTKDALKIENDSLSEEELTKLWNDCLDAFVPKLKDGGVIYAAVPPGPLRQIFSQALKERDILRQELVWVKDSMVLGRSDYHYKHEPILYGWKPGAAHYMTSDRSKTSVLEFARPKRSAEHPTMKPIPLWVELISNSSKKGERVFDPFLGSGTTLIASEQANRICYGMEIDPKYCHVIVKRYLDYCTEKNRPFELKINGEEISAEEFKA